MGVLNERSATVTALCKFYHSDTSRFLPTVATTSEYPHEIYAVTKSTSDATKSCVIRLVKDSASTWKKLTLANPNNTATFTEATMSGLTSGVFARLGGNTYYANGVAQIRQIRPRQSPGDTIAKFLYIAGVPDPNSKLNYSSLDDTSDCTYSAGTGAGSGTVTRSIQHRREGRGAVMFSQETPGKTATLTITGTNVNWQTFEDAQTASGNDYFACEIYRFDKETIAGLYIRCKTDAANYYTAYVAYTSALANPFSSTSTWNNWHPSQSTQQAVWANNVYDNQMFNIRIRKNWFGVTGSPSWTAINTIEFKLVAASNASSARPAKIAVDYVRTQKTPPIVNTNAIRCASCEQQEDDSTYGWLKETATFTKADFSFEFAREGASCVVVAKGEKATLKFTSAKDFGTFPDGSTADTSCVLRCNVSSKGFGYQAGFNWASFTCPSINFIDNVGQNRQAKLFTMGNFVGGGACKQILMYNTNAWTGSATFDWTKVVEIELNGPNHATLTPPAYYFDDIRIERPYDAQQPVYIFEPIERYIIDAATEYLGATFKDLAWAIDLTGEALKWVYGNLTYHTYGVGWMTYPDFDHSSIGIAGCTLTSYGSKPFGCRFKFTGTHDLTVYKVPVVNYPPSWANFPDELGPIAWKSIPAGTDDKFSIWIASPAEQAANIDRVYIRLHGNNAGQLDPETYIEYSISGQELLAIGKEKYDEQKEFSKLLNDIRKTYNKNPQAVVSTLAKTFVDPTMRGQVSTLVQQGIEYLGADRGGWPSAVFSWKRKDMVVCENSSAGRRFNMAEVRGISIELVAKGAGATICVDNFLMKKEGSLNGDYQYVVLLEDNDGNLSPASEFSKVQRISNGDAVLTNIYVPSGANKSRVVNKRIYRVGGNSSELRHVGNCAVSNSQYFDKLPDDKLGQVAPEDAYPPPICKVMEPFDNIMYYGNIVKDRFNETYPFRIVCSEPFVPFRVSDFSALDIPEDGQKGGGVVAMKGYYNYLCAWTDAGFYTVPKALAGPAVFRFPRGCIARNSVAVTPYGIVWLSREGLMLGDISRVDDNFFKPVNKLFESYTEDQLSNAQGFCIGQYYYLFYNQNYTAGTGSGICCYLPERTFSELSGPFDIASFMKWDGSGDGNDVYIGRGNGKIFKLFDGLTDDGNPIVTYLRTRDFSYPGIQYEKWLKSFYLSLANTQTAYNTQIMPVVYVNGTAKETMPIWTATTTTVKTFVQPAVMGDEGTHIGMFLTAVYPHKITEMVMKVEIEEDVEYKPA